MTDPRYRLYFTRREEGWPEYLTWTPPDDPVIQPIKNHVVKPDLLPSEEVLQILEEYCRGKGIPVPQEDYDACMEEIRRERNERENPTVTEFTPAPVVQTRPEYGTPEYWKWWWKTKPERDAKKKAEQDAKEARQKERDDKKAAKDAEQKRKTLEKLAKAEAKAQKEQAKQTKKK
jgi:hypothetical protein